MFKFKKISLLLFLVVPISIFSGSIVDYNPEHKDAIVKIAFQDPNQLFVDSNIFNKVGYSLVAFGLATGLVGSQVSNTFGRSVLYAGAMSWGVLCGFILLDNKFDFTQRKNGEIEKFLQDPLKKKNILVDNKGNVIGFSVTFIAQESSIEKIKKAAKDEGHPMTLSDDQLKAMLPSLKVTNAECKKFLKIECLAVSRDYRGKGYGTQLIRSSINNAKNNNDLSWVELDVANNNTGAKRLYERLEFVATDSQPIAFGLLGVTQLRKSLQ